MVDDDIGGMPREDYYIGDVNDLLQFIEDSCETSNSTVEYIDLDDNKLFIIYQSFVEEREEIDGGVYEQVFKIEINNANDFVQDLIDHL